MKSQRNYLAVSVFVADNHGTISVFFEILRRVVNDLSEIIKKYFEGFGI